MVDAGGAAFEEGGDDGDVEFLGEGGEGLRAGAGDGFGEIEEGGVFLLAEILGTEKFLRADDLGAAPGGLADFGDGFFHVGGGVGGAGHLNDADGVFGIRHGVSGLVKLRCEL